MKKKLHLKDLKVQSFVTSLDQNEANTARGGSGQGPCYTMGNAGTCGVQCQSQPYHACSLDPIICSFVPTALDCNGTGGGGETGPIEIPDGAE